METKIQLTHPAGKKAVTMEKGKYDVVRTALLNCLNANGDSTHKVILRAITDDFENSNTNFDGSIEWHMEWVKLDLEARKEITRIAGKTPVRFAIVK